MEGVIIMIGGAWLKVPAKLFNDKDMTRADIAVFAYAADRLKTSTAKLPISKIAAACELSERTVMRSIDKLCCKGYLRADKVPGKPTLYTQLLLPAAKSSRTSSAKSSDFDASKYDFVINNFGEEEGAV